MNSCIFCKIAKHEMPKDFIYEDENVMVFEDIYPVKPIHLLIVPKKHIVDFLDLREDSLVSEIRDVIQIIVKMKKLEEKGYRLTINGGGAQAIDHLHIHLTGPMGKAVKM